MPETFGLLGAGAQADEVEDFARPDRVIFRAVDAKYLDVAASTIDVRTADPALLALPVVAAVGAPGLRRDLVAAWGGSLFRRVVAERAWVSESAQLGAGVMIAPLAAVSAGAIIDDHALINIGATVSHDSRIGAFATLSPGVHVAGHCSVGDGVFLGIGASVIQGISIASGSVIGAGAVVVSDLVESGLYLGVPARRVRSLEEWLHAI